MSILKKQTPNFGKLGQTKANKNKYMKDTMRMLRTNYERKTINPQKNYCKCGNETIGRKASTKNNKVAEF